MNIFISKKRINKNNYSGLVCLFLVVYSSFSSLYSQTYLNFSQSTGTVSSQTVISVVSQSSGTAATVIQMNDLCFTTGALTTSMVNAWVSVDMGLTRTILYVDIGTQSSVSYINELNLLNYSKAYN
jgi:hypothetical protein